MEVVERALKTLARWMGAEENGACEVGGGGDAVDTEEERRVT